ncbi:MAG: hypothetical protein AVO35_11465 [Candidatus Aegiribacteria sp. MLS_C]|nr:MAG: hypothetical protein AVO35_11465 [Candidatus Aegiribacteria sp. MLS_C]
METDPKSASRLISRISDIQDHEEPTVRLTVPVRPDQEELLTRIARTVTQNRDRHHRSQRITKATIIRAYIDALSTLPIDLDNINDEKVLLNRILDSLED